MSADLSDYLFQVSHHNSSESRSSPRYRWDNSRWHERNFVIIQHTLSGSGVYENEAGRHVLTKGQAFLAIVPERSSYYYPAGSSSPWTFRWLNLRGTFSHQFWRVFQSEFGAILSLAEGSLAERLLNDLFHLLDEQTPADPLLVSERLYSFALAWQRDLRDLTTAPANPLSEAAVFCERHYRQPIKVKEIADHVGLSREHLTRIFSERYGMTPAAYLRELRLTAARKLLKATGHPLVEIAARTGFQDARQLRKWLRAPSDPI